MSFNQNETNIGYKPGYFLADAEDCTRITCQVAQNHAAVVTRADGSKYVPAGAVIPANGATAVGILYEDVDVSTGAMPGSIVTRGVVYEDRLPASLDSDAKTAMKGIQVITAAPAITRPKSFNKGTLASITVTSTEGTGSGKTDVALSSYTPGAGEKYLYKINASAAEPVAYGQVLPVGENAWTAGTFPLDEFAATDGYKMTVASVDSTGAAVAAGNATLDVKA